MRQINKGRGGQKESEREDDIQMSRKREPENIKWKKT
jgi:hypothetical protein